MAIKDLLIDINSDVKDVLKMDFELTKTQNDYVPNHEDPGLTFETGKAKKAKTIETCVLYVDIRNSTSLSKTKPKQMMARLYTAFTKSVLNIAEYHGGVVRNIIGDRVMVLFPEKNCFVNAIDTAISINTVSANIINKHFSGFNFTCGIGIDYGEKLVIKAGIPKQDKERANYKNLIWISNSANIASKLTDVANKELVKKVIRVTQKPINPKKFIFNGGINFGSLSVPSWTNDNPNEPLYLTKIETVDLSPEQFADRITLLESGELFATGGKLISVEKIEKKIKTTPILVSEKVFSEYKKLNPNRDSILKGWWTSQDISLNDYSGEVYGCDLQWSIKNEINF